MNKLSEHDKKVIKEFDGVMNKLSHEYLIDDAFDDYLKKFISNALSERDQIIASELEEMRLKGYPLPDGYYTLNVKKRTLGEHRSEAFNNALDLAISLITRKDKDEE